MIIVVNEQVLEQVKKLKVWVNGLQSNVEVECEIKNQVEIA